MNNENIKWWDPESLKESEKKYREISAIDGLNPRSDFGSYRRALLGDDIKGSMLDQHNDLNPVHRIKTVTKCLSVTNPKSILDAGCGVGYTSAALAKHFPNSKVLGVDISEDGIEYAKKHHHEAEFRVVVISPNSAKIGTFDLIFCFEFYPFSRNADVEFQTSFIKYFLAQLNANGQLVIYQKWDLSDSLSAIVNDVRRQIPEATITIKKVPHPRISDWFPHWAAYFVCFILEAILRREIFKRFFIVESRR
jgi:protein-L-isoaspartate O-methyltransferase